MAFDWDRDGAYTVDDEVTNSVISASWYLGYRQSYREMTDNRRQAMRTERGWEQQLGETSRDSSPKNDVSLLTIISIGYSTGKYGRQCAIQSTNRSDRLVHCDLHTLKPMA